MEEEEFKRKMLELATCKILPENWYNWWIKNQESLKVFLSKGDYLRIKPISHGFLWVPILTSQKGAEQYLLKNEIPFEHSSMYQKNYEKELDDYCKDSKRKTKELLDKIKLQYPALFERYPRFCNSLKNAFSEGDKISKGITENDSFPLSKSLPTDIFEFFKVVSQISLDSISINVADLRMEKLNEKDYLVLGEFWKEADGDLLLINLQETKLPTKIYYYSHSLNKVKLLCSNIDDLMEKKLAYFNNQ